MAAGPCAWFLFYKPHDMKPINTGKLPLDPTAYIAIMSLSLIVNLPGLAVTPMLDTLAHIFPKSSALEKQLLTMLPNLLIIPFVLMSGKLSTTNHKKVLIMTALLIFAGSTVGYMLSTSMLALIVFSCTLGIGAGILVPFSTGLLSDTFAGKPLMKQMGLQSAISNLTLVLATFAVGWLARVSWHAPFLVYAVCLVPLALVNFIGRVPINELDPTKADIENYVATPTDAPSDQCNRQGVDVRRMVALFAAYFLLTFGTISISEYLPFLAQARHFNPSVTGSLTSIFFLMVFFCGISLTPIIRMLRGRTVLVCTFLCLIGMLVVSLARDVELVGTGVVVAGIGYGALQPLFYNKATQCVNRPSLSTKALSIILTANYAAIVVEPLITQGICKLFHKSVESTFQFLISVAVCGIFLIYAFLSRKTFIGTISDTYYKKDVTK